MIFVDGHSFPFLAERQRFLRPNQTTKTSAEDNNGVNWKNEVKPSMTSWFYVFDASADCTYRADDVLNIKPNDIVAKVRCLRNSKAILQISHALLVDKYFNSMQYLLNSRLEGSICGLPSAINAVFL